MTERAAGKQTVEMTSGALQAFALAVAQTLFSVKDSTASTALSSNLQLRLLQYLQSDHPIGGVSPLTDQDREALRTMCGMLDQAIQIVSLGEGAHPPTDSVH